MGVTNTNKIPVSTPTIIGQVSLSLDGSSMETVLPVTDPAVGWLMDNITGIMIVV
jgi:hypothetical protein